jgi:DNA-binding beta-propeller fold protein YncE
MTSAKTALRLVAALGALVIATDVGVARTGSPPRVSQRGGVEAPASRLLVLLRDAGALAIVDPASEKILGRVPTVKDPHEVAVTPDGRTAYVASPSQGIAVIDVVAMKEVRRLDIEPGSAPHDVLFAGGKLYFTAEGHKVIGRYDPATNKMDWHFGIGQDGTHMLVMGKSMDTLFMPNRGSNSVSMIEGLLAGPPKWRITAIPVPGKTPEGIDLSPDGRELWTATRGDGGVAIIDVAGKKVTQNFNLGMSDANRLKFTPNGRNVLILDGGTGTLVVLDAASRKEIKRIKVAPGDSGDGGIYVLPDGSRAYLGLRDDHSVAVVDLKTFEVASRISTGAGSGPGCIISTSAVPRS